MKKQFKLGLKPRHFHRYTLALTDYMPRKLPAAPPTANWGDKVTNWGMMLNDSYGDCAWAAAGHAIETWTANANDLYVPPDADILTGYESTGFSPDDPSTDNGTAMTDLLAYWRDTGISGRNIVAWAEFDPSDAEHWRLAISIFGLALVGVQIRQSDMDAFNNGSPWTPGTDGVEGGHAIIAPNYDASGPQFVTWGAIQPASWAWALQETDEAYVAITKDWLDNRSGKSPSGLDESALIADASAID